MESIMDLPLEILVHIMVFLPVQDVFRFCKCNKLLYSIPCDYFWKRKLEHDYSDYPIPAWIGQCGKKTYTDLYMYGLNRKVGSCNILEIPVDIFNPKEFYIIDDYGFPNAIEDKEIIQALNTNENVQFFIEKCNIR